MIHIVLTSLLFAAPPSEAAPPTIEGDYLEVRTCDVYTGPCFANAEVGLLGKEATVAWRVDRGELDGVDVAGLAVVAVVEASATLGDPYGDPLPASAHLFVDDRADEDQQRALSRFAATQLGELASDAKVKTASISMAVGCCDELGCAELSVGDEIKVQTRCLCDDDVHCGNEEIYYPPLTGGVDVIPVVATDHTLRCEAMTTTITDREVRGAFLGSFDVPVAEPRPATSPASCPVGATASLGTTIAPVLAMVSKEARYELVEIDEKSAPSAEAAKLPSDIPEAFAKLLDPRGLRLKTPDEAVYDIWLRKELPLADASERMRIKFPAVPEGSFLGVIRSYGLEVDYRESDVEPGFYAMRYALQPEDGDHMGTADTRDFVILTGFDEDTDPAPVADDVELSELSILASSSDHPLVCYLIPPRDEERDGPAVYRHPEREEWVADLILQARAPDAEKSHGVRVGLVLIGISPHF